MLALCTENSRLRSRHFEESLPNDARNLPARTAYVADSAGATVVLPDAPIPHRYRQTVKTVGGARH